MPKAEAPAKRCSIKKVFLEFLENSQENTRSEGYNFFKKETLAHEFSCKF